MRTLAATLEAGSITAAARMLNLTQPAVSQQLRELERSLGVRLIERAGGKAIATAAGQAVLAHAIRAQAAVEDAVATASSYRDGGIGRVRLGTGATACIHVLPPVLAALKRRMPGLDIVIATGNSTDILRRVEVGELDAGLVTVPTMIGRTLNVTRLMPDPLVALIPDTINPGTAALGPAQLARLPLILYEPGGRTRAIVDGWFRRAGLAPKPVMELGSVEAIKVLVASGLGATILPSLAMGDSVRGASARRLRPALAIALRREKVVDRGLRLLLEELNRLRRG